MVDALGNGISLSPGTGVAVPNISEPSVTPTSNSALASSALGAIGSVIGGPLGGIAGSIIGGMFGKSSAKKQQADAYAQQWQQNIWNAEQAQAQFARSEQAASTAREFAAAEAEKNRLYQTQMSNTAHQREIADLAAAGLNPILSVSKGGGGASTPMGSMPAVSMANAASTAPSQSATVPDYGASSARAAEVGRMITSGLVQAMADIQKTQAETDEINARATNVRVDSWLKTKYGGLAISQANTEDFKPSLMTSQAKSYEAQAFLDRERATLVPAELALTRARTAETAASAKHAQMIGEVSSSDFARYMEYLSRATKNIPGFGVLLGK